MKKKPTKPALPEVDRSLSKPGPRTLAGRKKSSLNAVKFGLTAKSKCIAHLREKPADRKKFDEDIIAAVAPRDQVELSLCENLADLLWAQRRLMRAEKAAIEDAFRDFSQRSPADMFQNDTGPLDLEEIAPHAAVPRLRMMEKLHKQSTFLSRQIQRNYESLEFHRRLKPKAKLTKIEKIKNESTGATTTRRMTRIVEDTDD